LAPGKAMDKTKAVLYTRYPISSIIIYNGITISHFVLGFTGLIIGYGPSLGYLLGSAYHLFAIGEMYILMPHSACPNCPYYKFENSLCVSGLNVISKRLAKEGNIKDFPKRAKGILCSNNLYLAGFILPIVLLIPAAFTNFSFSLLGIILAMIGLLAFRFFIIFPKIACGHCRAKNVCPNAQSMGLNK
jgi:hypothetical protein